MPRWSAWYAAYHSRQRLIVCEYVEAWLHTSRVASSASSAASRRVVPASFREAAPLQTAAPSA